MALESEAHAEYLLKIASEFYSDTGCEPVCFCRSLAVNELKISMQLPFITYKIFLNNKNCVLKLKQVFSQLFYMKDGCENYIWSFIVYILCHSK